MADMQVNFKIPEAQAQRAVDAFAAMYGYQEQVLDEETGEPVPNPQSKGAFAKGKIREYIKEVVKAYEAKVAAEAARVAALEGFSLDVN